MRVYQFRHASIITRGTKLDQEGVGLKKKIVHRAW